MHPVVFDESPANPAKLTFLEAPAESPTARAHGESSLVNQLKSLFFYEDAAEIKRQLRLIVNRFETGGVPKQPQNKVQDNLGKYLMASHPVAQPVAESKPRSESPQERDLKD
jgi:hypothetical protein